MPNTYIVVLRKKSRIFECPNIFGFRTESWIIDYYSVLGVSNFRLIEHYSSLKMSNFELLNCQARRKVGQGEGVLHAREGLGYQKSPPLFCNLLHDMKHDIGTKAFSFALGTFSAVPSPRGLSRSIRGPIYTSQDLCIDASQPLDDAWEDCSRAPFVWICRKFFLPFAGGIAVRWVFEVSQRP